MSNIKTKRLFTAFNLPTEIKEQLKPLVKKLSLKYRDITWVRPGIMHVTLHFLGDAAREDEEKIIKIMASNENKFSAIDFEANEINFFPNEFKPRVIFINCQQTNGNSAVKLQKELLNQFVNQGIKVDLKQWYSHITLGRIKVKTHHPIDKNRINRFFRQPINFSVDSYDLIESQLTLKSPVYYIIRKFNLFKSV